MFLVVEGPNGVGKTTVIEDLATVLQESSQAPPVVLTKEPSTSSLGTAIREMEEDLDGLALGMACAADRLDHVRREIRPALETGAWVVCDRYVASSLVLQRLDGVEPPVIWSINETVLAPDLTVYLENDPDVIEARLQARPSRSRLERAGGSGRELAFFREARDFLADRGWAGVVVDCSDRTPRAVAREIAAAAGRESA